MERQCTSRLALTEIYFSCMTEMISKNRGSIGNSHASGRRLQASAQHQRTLNVLERGAARTGGGCMSWCQLMGAARGAIAHLFDGHRPQLQDRNSNCWRRRCSRRWIGLMQLSFHDEAGARGAVIETSDLRVTGGVLWTYRGDGLIATYSDHSWTHRGNDYHSVSVAGGCCLLFGITRDPSFVTEPIELFSFTGPTFRANGVAVAQYIEQQEMWHGLIRPNWWRAMRVINAATASALVDESHVVRLNPWDPVPGPRALPAVTNEPIEPQPVSTKSDTPRRYP
jgi:hypothetical protein